MISEAEVGSDAAALDSCGGLSSGYFPSATSMSQSAYQSLLVWSLQCECQMGKSEGSTHPSRRHCVICLEM